MFTNTGRVDLQIKCKESGLGFKSFFFFLVSGLQTPPAAPLFKGAPWSSEGGRQSHSSRTSIFRLCHLGCCTLLDQARQFEEFCARPHTGFGLHSTNHCTHLSRPQHGGQSSPGNSPNIYSLHHLPWTSSGYERGHKCLMAQDFHGSHSFCPEC